MTVPVPWLHAFVDVPADRAEAARIFWTAATGTAVGPPWQGHPEFTSLVPPSGSEYLHVQVIGGPPRVHIDLIGDVERDTARLEELGARRVQPADGWYVMASPAGLPFCVCDEQWPHERPQPATWPGGHRSRLVQLCVDVPARSFDREAAFWRAATGWADEAVAAPHYRRFVHRELSPMMLLVQRLGDDDNGSAARAHLDLGADDLAAESERLVGLGARVQRSEEDIVVLEDPVGLPFCITGNDPA